MEKEKLFEVRDLRISATNDDGEPIPVDLVEKMDKARDFGQGLFVHGQMFNSAISLNFYNRDPASFELLSLYRELGSRLSLTPYMEGTHMYTAFGHLDGYSAYYYTYMWSLVIANKMKMSQVAAMVSPYPTIGEVNKRAAGAYFSPRLFENPTVKRVVGLVQRLIP